MARYPEPIVKEGVAVNTASNPATVVQVWAGDHRETQLAISADAVTGASDSAEIVHIGRLTWRVPAADAPNATEFANARPAYITG